MLALAALLAASGPPASDGVFSVADYGAVGDGQHDDTAPIQRAIDAAVGAGGGTVSWPRRGPYRVTAPLVVCPENPTRSWEDSWPPSTVHFTSYTSITLSSPAHAILRADPSGNWPSFASNLTSSGMLLLGVAVDGGGCSSTPLYSEIRNLQLEGTAPFTPSAWGPPSLPLPCCCCPLLSAAPAECRASCSQHLHMLSPARC